MALPLSLHSRPLPPCWPSSPPACRHPKFCATPPCPPLRHRRAPRCTCCLPASPSARRLPAYLPALMRGIAALAFIGRSSLLTEVLLALLSLQTESVPTPSPSPSPSPSPVHWPSPSPAKVGGVRGLELALVPRSRALHSSSSPDEIRPHSTACRLTASPPRRRRLQLRRHRPRPAPSPRRRPLPRRAAAAPPPRPPRPARLWPTAAAPKC